MFIVKSQLKSQNSVGVTCFGVHQMAFVCHLITFHSNGVFCLTRLLQVKSLQKKQKTFTQRRKDAEFPQRKALFFQGQ